MGSLSPIFFTFAANLPFWTGRMNFNFQTDRRRDFCANQAMSVTESFQIYSFPIDMFPLWTGIVTFSVGNHVFIIWKDALCSHNFSAQSGFIER